MPGTVTRWRGATLQTEGKRGLEGTTSRTDRRIRVGLIRRGGPGGRRGRRTRTATRKLPISKVDATKAAKQEAGEKGKRKRDGDATPAEKGPTSMTVESSVDTAEDEPRSPSPETKRKKAELLKVTEEDDRRYKEQLKAKAGAERKVPVRPPPRPLQPKLRKISKPATPAPSGGAESSASASATEKATASSAGHPSPAKSNAGGLDQPRPV